MGTWWNMGHCGIWNGFRMFTCWFMAMNSNLQDGEVAWKHPGKAWTPWETAIFLRILRIGSVQKNSVRAGVLSCFLSRFGQADDRRAKETEAFWNGFLSHSVVEMLAQPQGHNDVTCSHNATVYWARKLLLNEIWWNLKSIEIRNYSCAYILEFGTRRIATAILWLFVYAHRPVAASVQFRCTQILQSAELPQAFPERCNINCDIESRV